MRGIGFTVQTTDPQSASCPAFLQSTTLHTQLLCVCVFVFVCVLYVCVEGIRRNHSEEVRGEIKVAMHRGSAI